MTMRRRYLAVFLAVCTTACPAAPVRFSGTRYGPPPAVDYLRAWAAAQAHAAAPIMVRDEVYAAALLMTPHDPYSPLRGMALAEADARFASPQLQEAFVVSDLPDALVATRALAWQLGMTKAIPGFQVPYTRTFSTLSARTHAHLVKAGVRYDVANQVRSVSPSPAIAAVYAVALQLMYDKLARLPEEGQAALGLRPSVAAEVMSADRADGISHFAWYTLARVFQEEISANQREAASAFGYPQLSAGLRAARVAAAYREADGYGPGDDPCDAQGRARHDAVPGRALCFADATDRAVYQWFLDSLDAELDEHSHGATLDVAYQAARHEVARIHPYWASGRERRALAAAHRIEIMEWRASLWEANDAFVDDEAQGPARMLVTPVTSRLNDYLCEQGMLQ
jgi:hypothetical protein